MKKLVKLFSCLLIISALTTSAYAFFSGEKPGTAIFGKSKDGRTVYASHGKDVYWLTASIDEYENQPGNLTKVNYSE